MRAAFQPIPKKKHSLRSSDLLMLIEGVSDKYNHYRSIKNIKSRYNNTLKKLEVSLPFWGKRAEFRALIHELRQQGLLDWQILIALMNYVLNTKVNSYMRSVTATDEDEIRATFEAEFNRIFNLCENECYMEMPVEWLRTKDFQFNLDKMPIDTLRSFGLQNNMAYPNFTATRSFLNKRFNFNVDDFDDNNPLKSV
jgi:hypothetical protein